MVDGVSPVGCPSVSNLFGKSFVNVWSGMTLPPAPVLTLHLRVASQHFCISAGISMSAKASVPFVFTSAMVMVSSNHKGWLLQGTATAPTWFRADCHPSPYLVQDCCNPYLIHVGVIISSNFMDPVPSGSGTPVLLRHALSSRCLFPPGHLTLGLPVSCFATCLALGVLCRAGSSSWGVLFCAIPTGVLLSLLWLLRFVSLALTFLLGSFVDGMDGLGAA